MKIKHHVLASALVLTAPMAAFAQYGGQGAGASASYEKSVHDYGVVQQGAPATAEFVFTNTGTAPLIISNAKASSGAVTVQFPRVPIAPGQRNSITVSYDTKRPGPINKSVTVSSNDMANPRYVLRIKGNVEVKPAEQTTPVKTPPPGAPTVN